MACFVARPVGHPTNISRFLPPCHVAGYANYANLNFAMEFHITAECRVFDRITSNLDIALNISNSLI